VQSERERTRRGRTKGMQAARTRAHRKPLRRGGAAAAADDDEEGDDAEPPTMSAAPPTVLLLRKRLSPSALPPASPAAAASPSLPLRLLVIGVVATGATACCCSSSMTAASVPPLGEPPKVRRRPVAADDDDDDEAGGLGYAAVSETVRTRRVEADEAGDEGAAPSAGRGRGRSARGAAGALDSAAAVGAAEGDERRAPGHWSDTGVGGAPGTAAWRAKAPMDGDEGSPERKAGAAERVRRRAVLRGMRDWDGDGEEGVFSVEGARRRVAVVAVVVGEKAGMGRRSGSMRCRRGGWVSSSTAA